jgi:D-alanyl-D-alanine carboxypeptidase (penicillin-binding protein 5/6)
MNDIGEGGMNIGIMAGEKICFLDLLNAMLVCSANETANIIAENTASSREEFISMMNERAKNLGATNTNFVNTCGIHDEKHISTAKDMALIARHAMTLPIFREIVKKDHYDMPPTNKHEIWNTLYTTNKFLKQTVKSDSNYDIIGIKTGFTTPAGHNLITGAVNSEGMELISVILGVKNETSWENVYLYTQELLNYGFSNYSIQTIINQDKVVYSTNIENAKDEPLLNLVAEKSVTCPLPKEDTGELIETKLHLNPVIKAPINKRDILGYIEFFKEGVLLGKTSVVAANSIEEAHKPDTKIRIKSAWYLVIPAIIIFFNILRLTLRKISRKFYASRVNKQL